MRKSFPFLCVPAALLFLSPPALLAEENVLVPPAGGKSLLVPNLESAFFLTGVPEFGEKKLVAATDVPFTQAVELRTRRRPQEPWTFQLVADVPAAVHKGDVLWFSLWMRATEMSGEAHEGYSQASLEGNLPPYEKVTLFDLSAGAKWRQFAWSAVAARDYAPGRAHFCLRGGYAPQVIQIGGVQALDYGTSIAVSALPRSRITYPGMEADAPWRAAAAARIEKYRKADLRVIVKDAAGRPVSGAMVRMEEVRPAFGFGSAVTAQLIEGAGPDSDRYRNIIRNDYSKVVMENDLKWPPWEESAAEGHKTTLAALRWLRDQGIQIRGHNLVWPSWENSPSELAAFKGNPALLEQHIEDHIRDIVGATKGQLTEWDVVNEPYTNHDLLDLLPPGTMASWFRLVHQIDPRPVLYLNDYAGLTGRGEDTPHKQAFEKTLRSLQAQGAPIGGLGIQAHFGQELTDPALVVKELDRWAALGLDIEITEFDLNIDDEEVQGKYTRDFMTAVFSHPAVRALLTWGFWEGADWIPRAALYRKDWSIKPNGQAWNDLVLKEWHTDVTAPTDATGAVSTRGFLGEYRISVSYRGKSTTWPLTLGKDGAIFSAVLPSN